MNKTAKAGLILIASASVVGLIYPLIVGLPGQDEKIIPREASKWHIGKGSEYQPIMTYKITTIEGSNFTAKIEFVRNEASQETVDVQINDHVSGKKIEQKTSLNSAYSFEETSNEAGPYLNTLNKTVFSIRDSALEEKYLVKKAVWDTVFIGPSSQDLTVTDHEKIAFKFGSVDTFIVSYKIGSKENKFWIVDNLPLPVKAEIYDLDGNLQYSYELNLLSAPLTPGFTT